MTTTRTLKLVLVCVGLFILVSVFLACRYYFGTYSLFEAAEIYNTLISLDKKYKALFVKRENLRYHIGSAEARGEHQQALQMARDLEALDDDIDAMEAEIRLWKTGAHGRGKKEHFL
mmetsp:Transcript_17866/g.33614  ORF Transcript_17866/g.33614 Transcript_17866/m.33614 type:complete len:117 (-) Transcript_17866:73-423(-)|eukprot:CAMPEP_0114454620 /NCGR_PEP_ID=MMETSP0104-20121206/2677_1 /TAXON_ID=37642 ORGANISM="Paraphysomonas imperforata, Strain PA2" /NCGR_SAMPLE_ID=MMETSP0104 /ASSEMBLY_ACC=CAM_ASM_000202 /LENGTH=116 /DNA_ID=CAMNT_0001627013 /DNA_START=49 /DNA_END=399 /DNA_ORIENTATION=-